VSGRTAIRSTTPRLNWSSRRQSSKHDAPNKRYDYFFFAFRFFVAFFAFFAFFAMLSS
jgi:hypothetical protein